MRAEGWNAQLSLTFGVAGGKTVLADQQHEGPLMVQRPFYPEGEQTPHVYVLHPPGGVVGGDSLKIDVDVKPQAHALITTPAAGKFYRSAGPCATQVQHLRVSAGAVLEWMPQETILYNAANVRLVNRIELEPSACFVGWEVLCFGLPASGDMFQQGIVRQTFEILRHGEPALMERGRYDGGGVIFSAKWGLAGYPVTGTFFCATDDTSIVERIRAAVSVTDELFSATWMNGLVVCRYLGQEAFRAQRCFRAAWEVIRQRVLHKKACAPRIWKT